MNKQLKITTIVFITFLFVFPMFNLSAQNIGINSTGAVPNASAGLDIDFTNKGVLVPRIALTGINDAATIAIPATSLLIYNTNIALPNGVGYYYNSGTPVAPIGIRFMTGGAPSNDWTLLGNAGTTPATNFIGTTDAQDFAVYTNNIERMRVQSGGNVGIGTTVPSQKLNVQGNALISDTLYVGTTSRALYRSGVNSLQLSAAEGVHIDLDDNINSSDEFTITHEKQKDTLFIILDANGNTGIGTPSPSEKLEVNGHIKMDAITPRVIWNSSGAAINNRRWYMWALNDALRIQAINDGGAGGGNIFDFKRVGNQISSFQGLQAGNPWFTIDNSLQSVGIGTTTPIGKLDLDGTGSNLFYLGRNNVNSRIIASDGTDLMFKPPIDGSNIRFMDGNTINSLDVVVASDVTLSVNTPLATGGDLIMITDPIAGNAGNFIFRTGAASAERMRINGAGNVGIGTTGPTALLSVNGAVNNTTGVWAIFSDKRIKTIDADFTDGLEVIKKINPVKFHYNKNAPFYSDKQQIGIVAQELEKVAPYMVSQINYEDITDLREVNSQAYIFLLINAIKEQQQIIENQKIGIESLKTANKNQQIANQQTNLRLKTLEEFLQTAKK